MALGSAKVGDKTMVDAIVPTVNALKKANRESKTLGEAFQLAVEAANAGVKSTIPLTAKKGRARYLQEKAVGHQDAGATSFYYLIKAIEAYINGQEG